MSNEAPAGVSAAVGAPAVTALRSGGWRTVKRKGTACGVRYGFALIPAIAAGIALCGAPTVQAQAVVEGIVEWARRASLGTPVTGVVARVAVATGDRVESGQVLLALDPRRFDAAVAAARARVTRLAPDLSEAQREFERAGDMYDRTLISERDLELARIALARAEADLAHAQAMLRIAEIERERSVVRAPFAGVVTVRRVEVGEVVNARVENVPLIELGDVSRFVARALLAPDALPGWSPGLDAAVQVAGRRIAGTIRHVSLEPVREVGGKGVHAVDVEFDPPADAGILIGQRVEIERR